MIQFTSHRRPIPTVQSGHSGYAQVLRCTAKKRFCDLSDRQMDRYMGMIKVNGKTEVDKTSRNIVSIIASKIYKLR